MKFDLNLLLVFDALIKEHSVTRAGERLGLSQPAVSAALRRLRGHFQDPLFIRSSEGMVPTQKALELVDPLNEALLMIDAAVENQGEFDPTSSQRSFKILMMDVGEIDFLPMLLQHLCNIGSGISLETKQPESTSRNDQITAFEMGALDLALGYWPQFSSRRGFQRRHLFSDSFVCIAREDHPKIGRKLTMQQFAEASHVIVTTHGNTDGVIEQTLVERGLKRRVVARVPHFLAVPKIIANTDFIVTIPSGLAISFADIHPLRIHRLPIAIDPFEVSVYWHNRFDHDVGLKWMRETIEDHFGGQSKFSRSLKTYTK